MGRPLPAKLRRAYEGAVYRVEAPGRALDLRVGSKSAALDRCLEAHGVSTAAFLTAANPASKPLAEGTNRARLRRLRRRLGEAGFATLPGESFEGGSGAWREASLLALGIDRRGATELAAEFGQSALLFVRRGGEVRLLLTGR